MMGKLMRMVIHRIWAGWIKWRKALGITYDHKVSTKLEGKFYCIVICLTIHYGSEYWALKGQEKKVGVAKMRMLRSISGYTTKYKIHNCFIWGGISMTLIEEKMTKFGLSGLDLYKEGHWKHQWEEWIVCFLVLWIGGEGD